MGSYSFYQETTRPDELYHHGIKGMHWGIRRFQQANGSLTAAGKKRYLTSIGPGPSKMPANAKGGPGPLRRPANAMSARAQRAKEEAQSAHNLANKYTSKMDAKAAKRQAKADESGKSSDKARAQRAKEEAQSAHNLANKYTSKMDAKAAKRQAEADNPTGLKAKWDNLSPKQKTAIKAGASLAVAGLAIYGKHKISQHIEDVSRAKEMLKSDIMNKSSNVAEKQLELLSPATRNLSPQAQEYAWMQAYTQAKNDYTPSNRKEYRQAVKKFLPEAREERKSIKTRAKMAKKASVEAAKAKRRRAQDDYLKRMANQYNHVRRV